MTKCSFLLNFTTESYNNYRSNDINANILEILQIGMQKDNSNDVNGCLTNITNTMQLRTIFTMSTKPLGSYVACIKKLTHNLTGIVALHLIRVIPYYKQI